MLHLQLETTNVCNAACVFCPYPKMERAKGRMTKALSDKILTDAAGLGDKIERITFTGLGEPLLDADLEYRIRFAKAANPKWHVDVYTNGTFLTPSRSDKLAEAGLDTLYVSLNAVSHEKRKAIMDLDDYEKVCEQIVYAARLEKMRVIIKAIQTKDLMEVGEPEVFMRKWGGPMNLGGGGFLHLEGNWAGQMSNVRVVPSTACSRALMQIMVLWDGRVSLCCFDGEGKVILGDLNSQTIREVFNGSKALGIREAHNEGRRSTLPLCNNCTAI